MSKKPTLTTGVPGDDFGQSVNTGELDVKFAELHIALRALIKELVTPINALIVGVIIVLFVCIVTILLQSYTMVMDSNNTKAAAEAQMNASMINLTNALNQYQTPSKTGTK